MTSSPAIAPRRVLRGEGGFILIEILVSALILVTVSLAVFLTIDQADNQAGVQQRRALASNFAQSELERLRSLPVEDIAAARGTRTVKYGGVAVGKNTDNRGTTNIELYETITAKWVTDGKDEPECSTRSGGLDYLRLTVEVGWKGQGRAKNIKTTSYYTPPAGAGGGDTGSLSVLITDRNGDGIQGISVKAAGPSSPQETTNENGCVVFGFIPAGDYNVQFGSPGFVDGDSNASVNAPTKVIGGETQKLQFDYDRGGYTKVNFKTKFSRPLTTTSPAKVYDGATFPPQVQFFNAAQPTPPKTFLISGGSSWDGSSTPLFPFTSKYSVYAGNCPANANPSPYSAFVNISPSQLQATGDVYLPALDVRVMSGTNSLSPGLAVPNALVRYYPGCGSAWTTMTDSYGWGQDSGFPYVAAGGGGVLCAASPGSNGRRFALTQDNRNFTVGTSVTIYLSQTGSKPGGWTGTAANYDCTAP